MQNILIRYALIEKEDIPAIISDFKYILSLRKPRTNISFYFFNYYSYFTIKLFPVISAG